MGTSARFLLVGVLLVVCNAPAHAQDAGARHGFSLGLGLGYGSARFSCDTCRSSPRLGGWALAFDLGWMLNPHLRLGAGGHGWLHGWKGDNLPAIDAWVASVSYYPRIRGGPFVEGGIGLSHYMLAKGTGDPLESISSESSPAAGTGWGFTLGVGWEIPSGGFIRVTDAYGNVGTLHGSTVATGWKQNVLLLEAGGRLQLP